MSVRAYRINNIDREDDASFNLWHDEKLMDYLESQGYGIDNDNGGMLEIPLETIETAVQDAKALELDEWVVERLVADIEWAKSRNEHYLIYECF